MLSNWLFTIVITLSGFHCSKSENFHRSTKVGGGRVTELEYFKNLAVKIKKGDHLKALAL
jgi:hypothetical protein